MAEIRLYKNTRFNGVNKPESLSLVKNNGTIVKTITNGNIIQGEGLSFIDVELTAAEASSVDFVIVKGNDDIEVGYVPSMSHQTEAPNVVRFNLECAALSTILSTVDILSGSAERMSIDTVEDGTDYFTNIEPFAPAEEVIAVPLELDSRTESSTYNILETISIPPQYGFKKVEQQTQVFEDGTKVNFNADDFNANGGVEPYSQSDLQLLKMAMNGGAQYREIIDGTTNQVIAYSYVASTGDDILRKMFPTQLTLPGLAGLGGKTFSTGTRWWLEQDIPSVLNLQDSKNQLMYNSVINDLRARNADNNITGFWAVPNYYVSNVAHTQYSAIADGKTDNYGGITAISASNLDFHITASPVISGYEIKNNKAKYGQGLTLTVFNPVSGQSLMKQMWEISNPTNLPSSDTIEADYSISADLRKEGSPIFCWKYNRGNQLAGFPETLKGGNWRQIPVSGEGVSGSYYQQLQIDVQKKANERNIIGNAIGTAASIGVAAAGFATMNPALIGGGITGTVGNIVGFINRDQSLKDQEDILSQQGQVASAELTISTSNYVRDCGYNKFYGYYSVYNEQDVKDFDMFLTKYGYNVGNREFLKDDLYTRPYFNYIKARDVHFTSSRWSTYLLNLAAEEMKRGVRIWHKLPDEEAYIEGNQ